MRIRGFQKTVQKSLHHYALKNCVVVADAQNFFYYTYQKSKRQYVFGCECEKYAEYLRDYLSMFKEANVKCYFIVKGGHENLESIGKGNHIWGQDFVVGKQHNDIVMPIAMKDVYKQVLDEMDFDYTICKFESKKECIALAKFLGCPVISNDAEFCFAGISYIPYPTFKYNERTKSIDCKRFTLDSFLRIHNLTEDKLSIFIALTDEKFFPENYFKAFKQGFKIRSLESMLKWLSQRPIKITLDIVSNVIPSEDKAKFRDVEIKARSFVRPKEKLGLPSLYLRNRNTFEVTDKDPLWFEKGVAMHYIAIPYVNLYHHGIVMGSWSIQDENSEDAMLFSFELIMYAYNLMTNYKHTEIKFLTHNNEPRPIMIDGTVPKPKYTAEVSVFENGWREIKLLRLFEHFLENTLPDFDYDTLDNLPDDVRLLMIALIYFSVKKSEETSDIVYGELLSYVALSVVFEKNDRNNNERDTCVSKSKILQKDVDIAAGVMQEFFQPVNATDAAQIFDRKLNHVLMEFQHCLNDFNYMNKLCGSPFQPTVYSKTLNGTFVYKILQEISRKLNPATSVLAFFNGLEKCYADSVNVMCL